MQINFLFLSTPHVFSYLFTSHPLPWQGQKFISTGVTGRVSLECLIPTHHTRYPIPSNMMHHEISSCTMSAHDASCVLMMHHENSWSIMSTHDASWGFMMHHVYLWCIMGTHAASSGFTMHHEYSWCIMSRHWITLGWLGWFPDA